MARAPLPVILVGAFGLVELRGLEPLTPCLQRLLMPGSDPARCWSSPCPAPRHRPGFTGCHHSIGPATGTPSAVFKTVPGCPPEDA
jgi:hypothetical protein